MNTICIVGNLTRDPEGRTTQQGVETASFSVAVRRDYRNPQTGQYETDFFNCVAWRQSAEYLTRFAQKGSKVAVTGKMQFRKYTARDGSEKPIWELIVDHIELLKTSGTGEAAQVQGAGSTAKADEGFEEVDSDELPF